MYACHWHRCLLILSKPENWYSPARSFQTKHNDLLLLTAMKIYVLQLSECHWPTRVSVVQGVWGFAVALSWSRPEKRKWAKLVSQVTLEGREDSHQRHQQHVLRDSEAWRPNLKPLAEDPPASSTTGMRLPKRKHTHKGISLPFSISGCSLLFFTLKQYFIYFKFKDLFSATSHSIYNKTVVVSQVNALIHFFTNTSSEVLHRGIYSEHFGHYSGDFLYNV